MLACARAELLRRTEAMREQRREERLNDYYTRNYRVRYPVTFLGLVCVVDRLLHAQLQGAVSLHDPCHTSPASLMASVISHLHHQPYQTFPCNSYNL